jgi:hypothetical protein
MSCNRNDQTFQGVIKCFTEDLINNFVNVLGNDPYMNCSQSTLITQAMNVNIENATITNCAMFFNQTIGGNQVPVAPTNKKICVDVNKKLAELEGEKRQEIVNSAIDLSINNLQPIIKTKTNFIDLLKTLISDKLMNTEPPIIQDGNTSIFNESVIGCSQNLRLSQTQNITISGEVTCGPDRKIDISQEGIINKYMKCIIEPFLDDLLTNPVLRTAFNYSPNANCMYDLTPTSPCENNILSLKATIISPSRGSGTCPYTEGQVITQPCTLDQCTLGPWKKVSLCENGKEKYVRKIISSGVNCPETVKFENCTIPTFRPRRQPENINQPLDENLTRLQDFISTNQFLLLTPTFTTSSQKIIAIMIVSLFILVIAMIFIF